jgi:thiol-disulfide isomerase/thioredoxin
VIGQQLPQLHLLGVRGNRNAVAAEPGRLLVLNVFATWCPECKLEAPTLARLHAVYAAKAVNIVGIDQNESPELVLQFEHQYNWNFPVYIDDSHQTRYLLGAYFIPSTFVVDDKGRLWASVVGPVTLVQMEHAIDTGLAHLSRKV